MKPLLCIATIIFLAPPCLAQAKDGAPKSVSNSIGMKFIWVAPGSFAMGSPQEEKQRNGDEDQHNVTLTKGFFVSATLVTQEQWKELMDKNPSMFAGEKDLPMDSVSWNDCQEFIKKLRDKEKKPYRLPTEAEWEFACRASTKSAYHCGETISAKQSNFLSPKDEKTLARLKTTPVNSFPANAWGLHDMHGNLWQWCQDWYGDYPQKAVIDPQGPGKGPNRVLRGGSWFDTADRCRSACRGWADPALRGYHIGFRVCYFAD